MAGSVAIIIRRVGGVTEAMRVALEAWLENQPYWYAVCVGVGGSRSWCSQLWYTSPMACELVCAELASMVCERTTVDVFEVRHDWYSRYTSELAPILPEPNARTRIPTDTSAFY